MNRRKLIWTLVILFIAVNSLLVYLDEEEKVARLSYIEEWSEIVEMDMFETIDTSGVLATTNEKRVYFDEDRGSFLEFLIDEGTQVDVGDGLFTYKVEDYYETRSFLESERSKLTGEVSAIEQAIDSISFYQIPETDLNAEYEDENSNLDITSKSVTANYMKEQYLAEKEKELDQKNAQLQNIQAQLSDLESTGDTITVESSYQGQVTKISKSLSNPVVTIRDMQLQAEGEFTEAERMEAEREMPVEVSIRENGTLLKGNLNEINDSPKTVNVHGTSIYSFDVSFSEDAETEQLLPGFHADLAITTNKSLGATAVLEKQLFNQNLWKMTTEGTIHKQKAETGIHMNDAVEVTKGAKPGEWVAEEDHSQFREAATFITPLKLGNINWKRLGKYDNVNWEKYFVVGLLSR
ncbi:efflux RND transporter periplasmic adaptor subunit [Virgibacillus salinus]|uniref:HlyD family secretion protein n=1 Tax=Virgibacillus salinus TaxID=553311 RepID=A0A1H1GMK0_9BACI|nr:efflux RND transporter periplasmic adaptor subunit [Virgibacillus salinus]SDR14379.1 HlyD family secretion protein [Virgibacillus salinus]